MSSNIPIIFKWYLNRQGIQGSQGVQGEEGFSPTITVNEDTLTNYTLRVQNKNGSFITPNLRQTVQDSGGTYVRYERNSGKMFAGFADGATINQVGVVRLARPQEVIDGVEDAVITPANLIDYLTDTYQLPIATTVQAGAVKPDGTTITVDPDGTIRGASTYVLPTASTTVLGGVKVDGTTITIDENGVIKSAGGILPNNVLTKDGIGQVVTGSIILNYENFQGRFTVVESMTGISTGASLSPDGITLVSVSNGRPDFTTGFGATTENLVAGTNVTIDKDLRSRTITISSTGLKYQALTSAEYSELTPDPDTMYRLTDTNEVYLGTIPLTGGAGAQYKTLLINNYDNATQTNLGGSTTVQVTDTEV